MKLKKGIVMLISICICFSFCGCGFVNNTDELVSPPELTGDMYPIGQALKASAGSNYNLTYPTGGNRRSAIILEDINGDAVFEAFAFYSTNDDEMTNMHINVICQKDGEWISVSDQTIVANGVERVDFCDLNGNGTEEILVGWEVNGSTGKQLSVFSFEDGALVQKMLQEYTGFLCCDLDSNGVNEIFVHLLNTSDKTNKAIVYNYNDEGMAQTAGCMLDINVKSASAPVLSVLSSGQNAIYIDEIKGVGSVTEVLFLSRGELVNPLLDKETSIENTSTLRTANLEMTDINNDGIIEIPVASELPNAAQSDEKLYYTNWCSFNGEKLSIKLVTVVNTVDGYYLTLPNSLVGSIAVLKDTENHKRGFYLYDAASGMVGECLFAITAIDLDDWKGQDNLAKGLNEIHRNESTVFAVTMSEKAQSVGITADTVKEMFSMIGEQK